jgi:predicted nucleotidyltransferase
MNQKILDKLKEIKPKYEKDGFIILGLFGSQARDDYTDNSDVDILYSLNDKFIQNYRGFVAFSRLTDIKEELKEYFNKNIDLCAKSGLNKIGKKYILRDLVNV